jgi:hypothetical protein
MSFLKELWAFLRVRKKFWLEPVLLMMVVLGGLIVLAKGSAIAPFIYTSFRIDHSRHLGLYHDAACALVRDGEFVAAAQQERFTRRKFDARFPERALRWCLEHAGIAPSEVDHITFYDKPFLKFERLFETYVNFAPVGFTSFRMAMPLWLSEKLLYFGKNGALRMAPSVPELLA